MKLHLPTRLRSAVLACFAVVTSFTTTLATGVLAGGAFAVIIAGGQALAATITGTATEGAGAIDMNSPTVQDGQTLTFAIDQNAGNTYFSGTQTYTKDIIIKNTAGVEEDATGLVINNGFRGNIITFTGKVTGDGVMYKTAAGTTNTWVFSGDVHEYTGDIKLSHGKGCIDSINFKILFENENNSTENKGVSGIGDISFDTGYNSIAYNYSGKKTVYITNVISATESGQSIVVLKGTDEVVFTKDVTIHKLRGNIYTGDNNTLPDGSANASKITFKGENSTLGKSGVTNELLHPLEVSEGATLNLAGTINSSSYINILGSLAMDDGAQWNLLAGAQQTLTAAQLPGVKAMEIREDATLTLTEFTSATGSVAATQLSGAGKLVLVLKAGDNGKTFDLRNFAGNIRVESVNSSAARLQLSGSQFHANALITLAPGNDIVWNAASGTFGTAVELEGDSMLHVNSDMNVTFSSTITGENGTLQKEGSGTLILDSGTNIQLKEFIHKDGALEVKSGYISGLRVKTNGVSVKGGESETGYIRLEGVSLTVGDNAGSQTKHTTGQLIMGDADNATSTLTINPEAQLVISGGVNEHSNRDSLVLGHYTGATATLNLEGGDLHAENAEMLMSWNGKGIFHADSGYASLKGINFWAYNAGEFRGEFLLGGELSGEARVDIGSGGIIGVAESETTSAPEVAVKLGNGTLGATADWSLTYNGNYTPVSVQFIGTAGGTVFDTSGHSITIDNPMTGGGKLVKAGEGDLYLKGGLNLEPTVDGDPAEVVVNAGTLHFANNSTNSVKNLTVNKQGALSVDAGSALTVSGNTTLAAPITLDGTLTLQGTLTVDSLDGFVGTSQGASFSDGEHGFVTGRMSYELIQKGAAAKLNDSDVTLAGAAAAEAEYVRGYGILTVDSTDNTLYWVNEATTGVTAVVLEEGQKYKLNGGTLSITAALSPTDAAEILTETVGPDGTIELTTEVSLANGAVAASNGNLIIKDTWLNLGGSKEDTIDISSFSSVELSNATISYKGGNTTIRNVIVKQGNSGTIDIPDIKGNYADDMHAVSLAGSTRVDGTLKIKGSDWKAKVNIASLDGEGTLNIEGTTATHANESEWDCFDTIVNVDSLKNYSGTVSLTKGRGATVLNAGMNGTVSLRGLQLANGAEANFSGTGILMPGTVSVTGTGNALTSSVSSINLSKLEVSANATLDLNGKVSALLMNQAGTVDTEGVLLTDGAELSYGSAANLLSLGQQQLAGSVLIAAGIELTETGINLGLSSEIDENDIDIATHYSQGGILEVRENQWYLKTLVAPDNVLLVTSKSEEYDNTDVTGKDTIRLAGGTLTLGNTDVSSDFGTLQSWENLGGTIIANGTENELVFNSIDLLANSILTLAQGSTPLTVKVAAKGAVKGVFRVRSATSKVVLAEGNVLDLTDFNITAGKSWGDIVNAVSGPGTLKMELAPTLTCNPNIAVDINTNLEQNCLKLNANQASGEDKRVLTITENGSLTVGNASEAGTVPGIETDTTVDGVVIIESSAKLKVDGGALSAEHIMLGHNSAGHPGSLEMTAKDSGSITTGSITLNNTGDAAALNNEFKMNGGTLEITTAAGIGEGIKTVITKGTLKADKSSWSVTGAELGSGSAAVGVGEVQIVGTEKITLINPTIINCIDNRDGEVVLSGTVNVSSGCFGTVTKLYGGLKEGDWSDRGIGYFKTSANLTLFNKAANVGVADGVKWQMDGVDLVNVKLNSGSMFTIQQEEHIDYTTLWINEGLFEYFLDNEAISDETTTLLLAGNTQPYNNPGRYNEAATLQLNTSLKEGLTIQAHGCVTNISQGETVYTTSDIVLKGTDVVLRADQLGDAVTAERITLKGNGTYVQSAANNALTLKVGGVTDSENWTGTVRISGNVADIDLNNYGNVNSTVELDGLSAYWRNTNYDTLEFKPNIKLGDGGVTVKDGHSNYTTVFSGNIEGTGNWVMDKEKGSPSEIMITQKYEFTGDVSGWNGAFIQNEKSRFETELKFNGSSAINTDIDCNGGTLAVIIDDANLAAGTTVEVKGDISATSLTVTGGTTAKVSGELTLTGALTTNGTTQLEDNADDGITLGEVAGTGKLEVLAGDLTLNKQSDFSAGTLEMKAGSTLTLDADVLGENLKDWTGGPLLQLGTLDTRETSGGVLTLNAKVSDDALWSLKDGDTLELVTIGNCLAAPELLVNGLGSYVPDKDDNGFKYAYSLLQTADGGTKVLITAEYAANGWVAEDTDPDSFDDTTWKSGDTAGDGKWAGSVGKFFGFGESTVRIDEAAPVETGDVVVSLSPGAEMDGYTFVGGELKAASLAVNSGELTIANKSVSTSGNALLANDVKLTVNAESTLTVGGDMTLTAPNGTTPKFDNKGTTEVTGKLSVAAAAEVSNSGTLTVGTLDAAGASLENTGTLVSVSGGELGSLTGRGKLVNRGELTISESAELSGFTNTGTLTVQEELILTETVQATETGAAVGTVQAGNVILHAGGNELGILRTDTITMAEGLTLSTEDALLTVESVEAWNADAIEISVSESAFNALAKDDTGRYADGNYRILNGAESAADFIYANGEQLQTILYTGVNAGLTVSDGVLSLSISTPVAGEGMVWNATDDNNTADNGYVIPAGEEGFYKALDYVEQVQLKDARTFDLSAEAVGDSVAGNASEPPAGLLIRNLSGGGELTVKGNSSAQDVATFLNTPGKAIDAVALTADAATVNLGLPEGTEGCLASDADSVGPTLESLSLKNRAKARVNADAVVLNATDVANHTELAVAEGMQLTTGMLKGTDEALLSGAVRVKQGGVYTGAYAGAVITADTGSELRLRTGARRTLGVAANADAQLTLDSAGMDGNLDFLQVGENPRTRALGADAPLLDILNATVSGDTITHSTLTVGEKRDSYINGAVVQITLGATETAATALSRTGVPVVFDGDVDVLNSEIRVRMMGETVKDGALNIDTSSDTDLTLARFVTGGLVSGNTVTLTGTPEMLALLSKYYTNVRMDDTGRIKVDRVKTYYTDRLEVSGNAQVGIDMADAALVKLNPQANRTDYQHLAGVLDALDAAVADGDSAAAETLGAAVSGASVAALGAAVAGDVERQLMGIRNRTTTMGVDQTSVNQNMPYFNAWINAEGDFRTVDADGTASGYELSSWGGTVGFDVDCTPRFTLGLAATAMYGDFTAKSADKAEGDLDTYYVTAFARYAANRWSHTFVATVGMADTSLRRTVSPVGYTAEGDSEATTFGFLYELGYVAAMNESATACLQPVFNVMLTHSSLDGCTEEGTDAALSTGGVDMTTVTFGLGARVQAIVGTDIYNRSSMVEARALLKLRAGDREAESENELAAVPGSGGTVTAAELSTIGAEIGVGITIPMGADGGSVFADASLEVGSGSTNINGTVGYRINF